MQKRHSFNVLAMELSLPCIKPPKLYVNASKVREHKGVRWDYQNETKKGKHGYVSFLGTATLSEAMKQIVVTGCTRGCHIKIENTDAASGHEVATIISSVSDQNMNQSQTKK